MKKLVLITSIGCFVYFLSLILLFIIGLYFDETFAQVVQFFTELLTIPMALLTLFLFVFTLIKIIKKEKEYLFSFVFNLLTVLMSVFMTI